MVSSDLSSIGWAWHRKHEHGERAPFHRSVHSFVAMTAPLPAPSDRIDAVIGATPIVRLQRVTSAAMAEIWVKIEGANPGGSIKDRTALAMVVDAERRGVLNEGDTIVERTSGNTGIRLARAA